jgi:hypothetical protein
MTEFRPYVPMILFKYNINKDIVGTIYKFYLDEQETWVEQLESLNLRQYQKDNFWKTLNEGLNK